MRQDLVLTTRLCIAFVSAFIIGAAISFGLSGILTNAGIHRVQDIWFEADTARVYYNLIDFWGYHYRTSVHPLTSLLLSTPTLALRVVGLTPVMAARVMMAVGAGLLTSTFFVLCQVITGRLFDATIYTGLLLASASFLFFAGVTELYVWGSATILLAILSLSVPEPYRPVALIVGSVASFSITITNWMAGLAASVLAAGWKDAVKYTVVALGIGAALAGLQSNIYRTGPFLQLLGERQYATIDIKQRISDAPKSFLLDPIVLSGIRVPAPEDRSQKAIVPDDRLNWVADGRSLAMALWMLLAAMAMAGSIGRLMKGAVSKTASLIFVVMAGQITLHTLYGEIPLLYSAHFVPLLIAAAAFTSRTQWRTPALIVASALVPLAAIGNYSTLREAARLLASLAPPA
jgi:hypothetical protein